MKVLLVSYALSPSRGSEPAIGWGWASGLARLHDVTVVSRAFHQDDVDSYLKAHPELSLEVKWVAAAKYSRYMTQAMSYLSWLKEASKLCERLVVEQKFDVIHFVSLGSLQAPIRLWKLGVPFLLGPVGGGQCLNPMYQEVLGPMPPSVRFRNLRVAMLPYRPSIRKMVRGAALVLATNEETEQVARRCGGKTAIFNNTGIREEYLLDKPPLKQQRQPGLRMLWVGRMLYRKGVPIALHALKATGRKDFTLDLLGMGPMESSLRALTKALGLEKQVIFHGAVPFARVFDFYDSADLFVFPSVNDAFASQLLEAPSRGLPIVTLNHQGADTLLPDSVAWKVPVDTVKNTIDGMADAMLTLSGTPDRLAAMAQAAIEYARTESWPRRVERMSALYTQAIS